MIEDLQVYTTQEGIEDIKNNSQDFWAEVYATLEGKEEIKNNPQVYTTQEESLPSPASSPFAQTSFQCSYVVRDQRVETKLTLQNRAGNLRGDRRRKRSLSRKDPSAGQDR
ncbi:hypothetical protein pdam_00001331 [Pocillopora damicornis]|uniref:Uncharacterized protein n=1 Tax=Pocillopora damicornis TaxID=46731 RepID=A0A3M6TL41_POCDA|nr:hypothetical protein pdam_00001331 [Pocillopora damicornis]